MVLLKTLAKGKHCGPTRSCCCCHDHHWTFNGGAPSLPSPEPVHSLVWGLLGCVSPKALDEPRPRKYTQV